ncbi:MAG TPA: CDP-alcohol phosphatidyltransferase family protein [Hydrogenispora sp.]|jgi:cardiolipin synthase|nr:CDP-alcohol phosphatidyltransferase family protein [Hydrogenispora sp.]
MNTANLLSLSRLLLAPFILVFFSRKNLYGVIVIWALAALTDFLDGRMARKLGEISELGKILDPLADKMTLACSFIALMIWYELPDWLGVIYITKELLQLSGGLFFFKKKQKVIPSNYWGKASTFVFFVGLFVYCIAAQLGVVILSFGLVLSLIAFYTYSRNALKKNQEKTL